MELDSDGENLVVTWWETNQTDEIPVMRVSDDNGATFGPILRLATNGTIGEEAQSKKRKNKIDGCMIYGFHSIPSPYNL